MFLKEMLEKDRKVTPEEIDNVTIEELMDLIQT